MKIRFLPDAKEIQTDMNANLLEIASQAGIMIDAACAGTGKCGKCKVKITEGEADPVSQAELSLLSDYEISNHYRLACCVTIRSDMEVIIPSFHSGSTRKKRMTILPQSFEPENRMESVHQTVPKATMNDQIDDLSWIARTFKKNNLIPAPGLIEQIHHTLNRSRGDITATFHGDYLLNCEKGDTSDKCYGIAFDIGTTTVVGMLWDLQKTSL